MRDEPRTQAWCAGSGCEVTATVLARQVVPPGWVLLIDGRRMERYCSRRCVALTLLGTRKTDAGPAEAPYPSPDDLPVEPEAIQEEEAWLDDAEPLGEPPLPSDDDPQLEEDDFKPAFGRPRPRVVDLGPHSGGGSWQLHPDEEDGPPLEPETDDGGYYADEYPPDEFDTYEFDDPLAEAREAERQQWLDFFEEDSPFRSLWGDDDEERYERGRSRVNEWVGDWPGGYA